MKKFLLTYWLGIALLFSIFYWELSPLNPMFNHIQTDFTALLTSFTLPNEMMDKHYIFINSNYYLVIEKSCNGMIPYLFFLSSIIAFPSTIIDKIIWAIGGYVLIMGINVFRIWVITQFVLYKPSNFSLAHDFLGNTLLILISVLLFIFFIKTRKRTT